MPFCVGAGALVHRSNKPVSPSRHGFNKSWILRGITQHLSQPHDGRVQTVVEIYKSVARPQCIAQLFPAYDLAGMLQQNCQDVTRLLLQLDLQPLSSQLMGAQIKLEKTKSYYPRSC